MSTAETILGPCDNSSPTGRVCNLPNGHSDDHAFMRGEQVITTWPTLPPRLVQPVIDLDSDEPVAKQIRRGYDSAILADELRQWWVDLAHEEIRRTVPKAVEYGATDLVDIGRDLARTAGRVVTDEEAAELGVFFYIRGKLSRWVDAVVRGDRVSDDTLFDLGVYVRMAQRIRSSGGWPGVKPGA